MPTDTLISLDSEPAPGRRGLARSAAEARPLQERSGAVFAEFPCQSLLARCDSPNVPFEWSINPYRGCEFGCVYCYARYTHEFIELDDWRDFERRIFVKQGAAPALRADLRRHYRPGEWISIGAVTDPYQPAERRFQVTRSILEELLRHEGLRVSITTKSDLVLRDVELLQGVAARNELRVNVTITTPRPALARILEPRAPRPDLRFRAVAELNRQGVRAGVFVMPVLPRINDAPVDLHALAEQAAAAGASHFCSNVLFLRRCSWKRFRPFLEEHFPQLASHYRRFFGSDPEPLREYAAELAATMKNLRERYGLPASGEGERAPPAAPIQTAFNF